MLPLAHRIGFALFALVILLLAVRPWSRMFRRIARGRADTEPRTNNLEERLAYAVETTLAQSRTFRKRPWISFFHAFIFYGFVAYIAVNLVDGAEGYGAYSIGSATSFGAAYNFVADVLSALVLLGVVLLVVRRFAWPARRDFSFNARTLLHEDVRTNRITRDSLIVSAFILFHVGSRALGSAARVAQTGGDRWQPFATLLAHAIPPAHTEGLRIFAYWGALGSVLLFLLYFPHSKHIHIFMAPAKYALKREDASGVLPPLDVDLEAASESEEPALGAAKLEELAWPRLLDAYACIQCNRCQDVCPATATGKSLSPSALEINKRMELNRLARVQPGFETGEASPRPLLEFALTPEALWACTTCGACMQVCPVQDEPMLDLIDIRRQQVMLEGAFPKQLQSAFRGMERNNNPWGINHAQRLAWAEGLDVPTLDANPDAEILYWVGCAASYDPQSQKTARAMVQLLQRAGVNFAVLGKREGCTGDSARRAGNEFLYRQLADANVATLNAIQPRRIVATCPHCMNTIGREYRQIGGHYEVVHHTQLLAELVSAGRLRLRAGTQALAFHDPCYLGRHNGEFEAPRALLSALSSDTRELPRHGENSFCCGAGGAQFWKEEEPGEERIAVNRLREAAATLTDAPAGKVLAVGCPFCKSMLSSAQAGEESFSVRDVAELLLERLDPA